MNANTRREAVLIVDAAGSGEITTRRGARSSREPAIGVSLRSSDGRFERFEHVPRRGLRDIHGLLRVAVLAAAALGCAMARAIEPAPIEPPLRFEVSPFIGYGLGGSFELNGAAQQVEIDDHGSFALALDARANDAGQYELLYARQSTVLRGASFASTKLDVEYLHIGGTALLGDAPRFKPYILGGIGVTRLSPGPADGREDTRFSASLGLGMRVPISTHFSLRVEGRGFLTLINADTAIFCRSDQTGALCLVRARGTSLFQFDFLAGAAYAF